MNETREKLLDEAEFLFGENGYAATSLRQIIAKAEVNLASIHYHFGSKEELLEQVI
jgi:AcrR family transcriptional regulator